MDVQDRAGLARALAIACGVAVVVGAIFPWYLSDPGDGHSAISLGLADGLSGVGGWTIAICGLSAALLLSTQPRGADARSLVAIVLFVVSVLCATQDMLTVFDEYDEALGHVGFGLWVVVVGGTVGALVTTIHFSVAPPDAVAWEQRTDSLADRTSGEGRTPLVRLYGANTGGPPRHADAALDRHADTYIT